MGRQGAQQVHGKLKKAGERGRQQTNLPDLEQRDNGRSQIRALHRNKEIPPFMQPMAYPEKRQPMETARQY